MEILRKLASSILLVIAVVMAGFAYFYKQARDKARSRVGQLEAKEELGEILGKKEEAEDEALAKELEYKHIRDAYVNGADTTDESGNSSTP